MPGNRRPLHLRGGEQVVARHALGPGDLLEGHQAAQRHHLPVGAAHADLGHALLVEPEVAVGLRRDAVGAAEHVEVVDVGRAHEHAHGLEDVGDRHLQHLRLVAIDIDEHLRRGRGEGGEDVGDAGRLVGLGDELLRDARKLVGGHAERVLQPHREAGRRAHAAHRGWNEHQRLRLLDLRQLDPQRLGDLVDRQPAPVPVLEVVEHEEQQAGVGRGRERRGIAAGERVGVLHAGLGQQDVGRLAHDRIGALQRGAGRQLQRDDQDRPVEARNETGRQPLHEPAGERQQQRRS